MSKNHEMLNKDKDLLNKEFDELKKEHDSLLNKYKSDTDALKSQLDNIQNELADDKILMDQKSAKAIEVEAQNKTLVKGLNDQLKIQIDEKENSLLKLKESDEINKGL